MENLFYKLPDCDIIVWVEDKIIEVEGYKNWLVVFERNGFPLKKGGKYGWINQKNNGKRRDESRKRRVVVRRKGGVLYMTGVCSGDLEAVSQSSLEGLADIT